MMVEYSELGLKSLVTVVCFYQHIHHIESCGSYIVRCDLIGVVAGRENSGFIESDDEKAPKNRRVKNKQQDVIER